MLATVGGYKGNVRRRNRIAKLVARGLSQSEIARRLGVAVGTVSYYIKTSAPSSRVEGKRPYHRKVAPIVLGSTVNGSGKEDRGNEDSLLDLLWDRLTVEEKVQAVKSLKRLED